MDRPPALVLKKTRAEIIKTVIKNTAAVFRFSYKGWIGITTCMETEDHPRLTPQQLQKITAYSDETILGYRDNLKRLSYDELKATCEYQPIPLVDGLLRGGVHSAVVNIGCAYVRAESELCRRYPNVTWDMLDLTTKLEHANSDLNLLNAHYHSCYPLDWLEEHQDSKRYDVALTNRVLTLLSNSELRSYLKVLSLCTRYVVFCEVASVIRFARSINVDKIPPLKSLAARGRMMIHNYRSIFNEYGFDTIRYEAFLTPVEWHGSQHYLILGVAKNRVPI